ncbi:MAG: DNA primase [Deltaproteobacteria bacterium]|nr:DNA primase [Deltaproteobacteria bacterium]
MTDSFNRAVEEIKQRSDIVDVVSRHLTIKKSGRNYLGLCPFHSEKTPSFTVSPEKQIFHCFGCGKGGDAITFLMEMEHLSYIETIQRLAAQHGITLPTRKTDSKETTSGKEKLLQLNRLAADFFSRQLNDSAGKPARGYLEQRSLPQKAWSTFGLGFAPEGWHHLTSLLEKNRVNLEDANKAGLLSRRDNGGYYDKFRNRLIFPIHSVNGEIIAFGGRIIASGEPKYLNSPETPIYTKGDNLYGIFQAREHIIKYGAVIIVEGYMDLLALWAGGICNVVASLGTALTPNQVRLLKRYCANAYAIFDGDEAGQKAMVRSWEIFTREGMAAKAVVLPSGKDPDDFIKTNGAQALKEKLTQADSLDEFFFYQTIGKAKNTAEMIAAIRNIAHLVAEIKDDFVRALFIRMAVEKSGLNEEVIIAELNSHKTPTTSKITTRNPPRVTLDEWELDVIRIMADFPITVEIVEQEKILPLFTTEYLKNIGEMVISTYAVTGGVDVVATLRGLHEETLKEEVMKRITEGAPCHKETSKKTMKEIIRSIKKRHCRRRYQQLVADLKQAEKKGQQDFAEQIARQLKEVKEEEIRISKQ